MKKLLKISSFVLLVSIILFVFSQYRSVSADASVSLNAYQIYLPLMVKAPVPDPLAFPGAEGYGAYSIGGRGGTVIEVTNLNDSGPGSLRNCVAANIPRICVFRVGGIIDLTSRLDITNPYITIAGQTAPGDGITVRSSDTVRVHKTHDVIIRYIRFRSTGLVENRDTINIHKQSYNVIVDHCSTSWGTDEVFSVSAEYTESHNITLQWNIISEGSDAFNHSAGSLISEGAYKVSVHHNLYAHHASRTPKFNGEKDILGDTDTYYDFVNNVIYNWEDYATNVAGNAKVNIINNYYKAGPNTTDYISPREVVYSERRRTHLIFMDGNIGPNCPGWCDPDKDWDHMAGTWSGTHTCYWSEGECLSSEAVVPFVFPPVTTLSASDVYLQVLAGAGATLGLNGDGSFYWRRDSVDTRVTNEVLTGTGSIINGPDDVGGFPVMNPGIPYTDTDHDGMGDLWETFYGFNINDDSDNALDADGDGYTNLEEFLNGTNPKG